MRAEIESSTRPANDAQLIKAIRTVLERNERLRDGPRVNVSSCSFVVSLHGVVLDEERKTAFEEAVRVVPGVEGVKNEWRLR
jgi:osmotically-inducible protein OsmY